MVVEGTPLCFESLVVSSGVAPRKCAKVNGSQFRHACRSMYVCMKLPWIYICVFVFTRGSPPHFRTSESFCVNSLRNNGYLTHIHAYYYIYTTHFLEEYIHHFFLKNSKRQKAWHQNQPHRTKFCSFLLSFCWSIKNTYTHVLVCVRSFLFLPGSLFPTTQPGAVHVHRARLTSFYYFRCFLYSLCHNLRSAVRKDPRTRPWS